MGIITQHMSGTPNQQEVDYGWSQLAKARQRMEEIQSRVTSSDEESNQELDEVMLTAHIDKIVIDCQYCIEISTKSMFKIVGQDFPKDHGISFKDGRTQGFIHKIRDEFTYGDKISRAIFLTKFWNGFYQLSKYGAPEINEDSDEILHIKDAKRAIHDAEFCINLSQHLLDHIVEKYDINDPRPDPNETDFDLSIDPYSLGYE